MLLALARLGTITSISNSEGEFNLFADLDHRAWRKSNVFKVTLLSEGFIGARIENAIFYTVLYGIEY